MRERLFLLIANRDSIRITPAYAGKTRRLVRNRRIFRDHPRVCGKD